MKKKMVTALFMGTVLTAGMAVSGYAEDEPIKVGVSFGTLQEERWDAERERMQELFFRKEGEKRTWKEDYLRQNQ